MRPRCAALACAALILGVGVLGLLEQVRRSLVQNRSPNAHESMRIQMERARAHAPGVAVHTTRDAQHEQHILARGREALSELRPGEEFLVTSEQVAQILALSVPDSSDPHELQLLRIASRLPDQKTQREHRSLSIVKTNTVPPFVMVLQARGDHAAFLLQHMRGGQHAFHADNHEPVGAVLEWALEECVSGGADSSAVPSLMIDGGAYFGFFGFQAAAAGCDAVLVEPQRALAPFLAASALLNGAEFAKRVQLVRGLISGPALPPTMWPAHFHLVDRHGMSSYAVPADASAATTETFTVDGLLRLADAQSEIKRPMHKVQYNGMSPLPNIVALKLDIEGFEVAALQGVKQLALTRGQIQNILIEFGPAAHWLRVATGVTQPDVAAPKQRGSTKDHTHTDAIVGDPAVVASLLDDACHVLHEFLDGSAADGTSTEKQHAYELRWLVEAPGWRPVIAQEFALERKSTSTRTGVAIEYVVIPGDLLRSVMSKLMTSRRSTAIHLWLSLTE